MFRIQLLAAAALAALFAVAHSARADVINWTVSGSFDDGGSFSGTFSIDNVADTITQWDVTTMGGTSGIGLNTYTSADLADDSADYDGVANADFSDFEGISSAIFFYADLGFTDIPATAGSVSDLAGGEADIGCLFNSLCAPEALRNIVSGTAVGVDASPVPEPASLPLLGAGLIGLGALRRCRRKAA